MQQIVNHIFRSHIFLEVRLQNDFQSSEVKGICWRKEWGEALWYLLFFILAFSLYSWLDFTPLLLGFVHLNQLVILSGWDRLEYCSGIILMRKSSSEIRFWQCCFCADFKGKKEDKTCVGFSELCRAWLRKTIPKGHDTLVPSVFCAGERAALWVIFSGKSDGENQGWNSCSASVGIGSFLMVSGLLNHQQGQMCYMDLGL